MSKSEDMLSQRSQKTRYQSEMNKPARKGAKLKPSNEQWKIGCVFLLCGLTTVVLIIFSLGEMPKHSQARKSPSCQFYSSSFPKRGAWENCPAINRSDYTLQITPSSLTWLTKSFGEGHSQIIFSFSMQTRVTLVYSKIVTIRQSRCDLGLIWRQLNASSDLSSS